MVHLHVHSYYSLLEGTAGVRQLVARAVEHGMPALALTDTNGLYGAIPFYKAARAAGIHPILGANLDGTVLLARDREGYARLCELLTSYFLFGKKESKQRKTDINSGNLLNQLNASDDELLFVITENRLLRSGDGLWEICAYSGAIRPLIPVTFDHPFQSHSATCDEVAGRSWFWRLMRAMCVKLTDFYRLRTYSWR